MINAGDDFQVRVRYYLDPRENWGDGTKLILTPLGPWIDNPDGKYTTTRHHVDYPGLGTRVVTVQPGHGAQIFSFRADRVYRYNSLLLVATFQGGDGKNWPWETRAVGPTFIAQEPYYQLSNGRPGGLFTYEEPVKLRIMFKNGAIKGGKKTLSYRIVDTRGAVIGSGEFPFTVGSGAPVEFTPVVRERGTFVLEAEVPGWGTREVVFARVPDVLRITGAARTQFAATNLHTDAECRVARMLGFTACREFMEWRSVQPGRDTWDFGDWDRILDTTKKHGIAPWLCITAPPNWVLNCPPTNIGYEPFPFDAAAWRESVATMTERWKDRISGWEWLNEIVPGSTSANPVQDYLHFCTIGTETTRKIKPALRTILAGGLWPRTFRSDLLRAGVGKLIDELPVHYSDMAGVLDARDDLDAAGCGKVVVTDDESSSGLSTWEMPTREMLQIRSQSQWVLERWPDELVAGARRITCFAGWTDPCGNWSYLLDEHTPRPMAATIAVLVSKLAGTTPVGKFYLPGNGVFYLFQSAGKAILVASSSAHGGERIGLNVGSPHVVVTDYQGNETALQAPGGKLSVTLSSMPVFIEGGSLPILQSYCAVSVGDSKRIVAVPQATVIKGTASSIPVSVTNRSARALVGTISITGPAGWPHSTPVQFSVLPGRGERRNVPLSIPAAVTSGEAPLRAVFTFKDPRIPPVTKPFGVTVIARGMVGNLLKNGGFEDAGSSEAVPADWSLGSATIRRQPSGGGLGLGSWVLKFTNAASYQDAYQTISPPPAHTYLYTAWIWNQDMMAGSNIRQSYADGTSKNFYTPQVFMSANSSPSWRFYACTTDTPPNLKSLSFTPVVKGPGWALYDNVRVTLFEGSKYAAECHRAKAPPRIDGSLDGWDTSCPIPLLCDNQLSLYDQSYRWTPENLSGVAYLMWDDRALYLTVEVIDDVHVAKTTGEQTLEGDSVAVAIDPANRAPGTDQKAFVYYLSSASPGGGSGAHTLYRPPAHSGGLSAGQLAKDSSAYELFVRTEGKKTTYQVRLPWSELGGIVPAFGSKFGLSLMLNDNDGAGRAACMSWGDGLATGWSPSNFGIATLIGP